MYVDPDLLYNADETGFCYKELPDTTLASKRTEKAAKGFKAAEDRLTVLVTCKSTGTHTLKLLVIGKSARPRCFRKMTKKSMPVYWKSNKTAWMNTVIFVWWLKECFVPEVKRFKRENDKPLDAKVCNIYIYIYLLYVPMYVCVHACMFAHMYVCYLCRWVM